MDKYYTPEIEEFHVGFEYEASYDKGELWYKDKIDNFKEYYELADDIQYNHIRVKYLDDDDFRDLGFKECSSSYGTFFSNGKVTIWWFYDKSGIEIRDYAKEPDMGKCLYCGLPRNKTQFKEILDTLKTIK